MTQPDADIFAVAARGIPQQIIAHEVGTGTEAAAGAREHSGANPGIGLDGCSYGAQIRDQLQIQGIQSVGTVEGDEDHVIPALDQQSLEFHDASLMVVVCGAVDSVIMTETRQ